MPRFYIDTSALIKRYHIESGNEIAAGRIKLVALSSHRLLDARGLFTNYGSSVSLRTLDAIHLATAIAINRNRTSRCQFVAADQKLLEVAQVIGLAVLPIQ